jgi:hypothetical protein
MKKSFQDPNYRLLIFLAALLITVGLWVLDGFPNPATPGSVANGIWFLLFGLVGVILFDFLHFDRSPSVRVYPIGCYPDGESDYGLKDAVKRWTQKANRALMIWCLSLTYEILVFVFFLSLALFFSVSGTSDIPAVLILAAIIGIPVFFLVMFWSEYNYLDAVKLLDPGLTENWKPFRRAGGPLSMSALFLGFYLMFLGIFLSNAISPILIPVSPASVSPDALLLYAGVTPVLATPVIIFLLYRRKEGGS